MVAFIDSVIAWCAAMLAFVAGLLGYRRVRRPKKRVLIAAAPVVEFSINAHSLTLVLLLALGALAVGAILAGER